MFPAVHQPPGGGQTRSLAVVVAMVAIGVLAAFPRAAQGLPLRSFHSEPSLHAPITWVSGKDPDPGSGDIFTDVGYSIQAGPVILSPQGQLLWFGALAKRGFAHDVAVQHYDGRTVLTYWKNYLTGTDVILDHHYRQVAAVRAGNGYRTDDHEFQITGRGTALISVDRQVHADLSSVGGPRSGTLIDNGVQEIDIATGRVLWQWDARDHVPVSASYAVKPGQGPYDFFHINSIQQLPDGNLLVSARHTWAVYEIDRRTGRIRWTLGGKNSSFGIGPGANFEWQHDARMQRDGTLTLFDDSAGQYGGERQSRALRIRLDYQTRQASLVHAYTNNPPVLSWSQGSVQVLPDGNTFVGFGSSPYFTEFGRTGAQLFSVHFGAPLQSDRARRFRWWGKPTWPPLIAAAATARGTTIYASWNGATGVASWRVLAGPRATALRPVGRFRRTDFETKMSVASVEPYIAAQALSSGGQVLATSAAVRRA